MADDQIERFFPIAHKAADIKPLGGDALAGAADLFCQLWIGNQPPHRIKQLAHIGFDESADAVLDDRDELSSRQSDDRQAEEHRLDEREAKTREADGMEIKAVARFERWQVGRKDFAQA